MPKGRIKPKIVTTAPCKDVILKEADVDLSRLPLFLHHDRDGHAYTSDNLVVSKDPDTGVTDWGIYRSMFRTINEKNFDMTCTSHRGRLNALKYQARGQNMPIAIVLGGPTLDKIAALAGVPPETEDFEVLGSFYGAPAELVKCETSDLFVPANAEIVLEGEVMATEGWVYDEGPYGEFTGMYGGGLKHNPRVIIHCMTYRKGGIYQTATIGGAHPGFTDNMLQLPAIESDIYAGAQHGRHQCAGRAMSRPRPVQHRLRENQAAGRRRCQAGARIMLTCSKQGLPKIAMVFDDDVDIWNDERIAQSMAFRYMPDRDTIIIPQCNTMSTDPKVGDPDKPFVCSKIGLDCTIPLVGDIDRSAYDWSSACDLGQITKDVVPVDKDAWQKTWRLSFVRRRDRGKKSSSTITVNRIGRSTKRSALCDRGSAAAPTRPGTAMLFSTRDLPTRPRQCRNSQTTIRATSRHPSRRPRVRQLGHRRNEHSSRQLQWGVRSWPDAELVQRLPSVLHRDDPDAGVAGEIHIGVKGLLGALYKDLAQKTHRGQAGVVRDGRHNGGRSYGYRPVPSKPGLLEIDTIEAEIVGRVFRSYLDGNTPRDIAVALNKDGIAGPRGGHWRTPRQSPGAGHAAIASCKMNSITVLSSGTDSGSSKTPTRADASVGQIPAISG